MTAQQIDETKVLSRSEIAAVIDDLKHRGERSVNSRMNLVVFRLATCCGLRVSEICGLKMSDVCVGVSRPYINIRRVNAKGKKTKVVNGQKKKVGQKATARRVPLWWDRATLDDLADWKKERAEQGAGQSDYFVCAQTESARDNPLDRFNVRDRFGVACRILGKQRRNNITIHDGRHSFVSHALAGGRSLAEVQRAAGHASISTTSAYIHIATDDEGQFGDLFSF